LSVVSFADVQPQPRYDGRPWTAAYIYEAAASTGPWTLIDTIQMSVLPDGVDTDPTSPQSRNLTTLNATLNQGWYEIAFFDGSNTSPPSDPVQNAPGVGDEIRPTVDDLGKLMRARTVTAGSGGGEAGTFNDLTRPTGDEAQMLLTQAVNGVLMEIGVDIPPAYYAQTRWVSMLYAAMLVELTFYRNEVNRDQSSYQQYEQLYTTQLAALKRAIAQEDVASPAPSFWSVPVLSERQSRFQAWQAAMANGKFDPSKFPPDMWFPNGPGGISPEIFALWPWLFGAGPFGDGIPYLEDSF
jgi:hypothetical protein